MSFRPRMLLALALSFFLHSLNTNASVTVYTELLQLPLLQTASESGSVSTVGPAYPQFTNAAAFDPAQVTAPAAPSPPITNRFPVQLFEGGVPGLSLPQSGAFLGFSVELSVADTVFGTNSTHLDPTFLNLLANIKARAGRSVIRVGGNTQEKAVFFPDGLPNGATILKPGEKGTDPTNTPTIDVGVDLIHAMASISNLVNTYWFIGIPFNDTAKPRLEIAEASEQLLGQYLLGFQLGNEPDLYGAHGLRDPAYNQTDYVADYGTMIQAIGNDNNISNKTKLIGPSVCCLWDIQSVLDAGWLDQYVNSLSHLAVERYPDTHCPDATGFQKNGSDVIAEYLSHSISQTQMSRDFKSISDIAQEKGKPLIMMETNTGSCGGYPGFSDTFGAALWGIDWALQMAYYNFTGAMMHLGGQNVYYNPFTPPPTKLAGKAGWTVGPMYYAALIVSEVFGPSNNSRIIDLSQNNGSALTPGYAIYENGKPTKVALINFIEDPSGANNYTADISIGGSGANQPNGNPDHVTVKYFSAPSVTTKYTFEWAGQTFGDVLKSNGILQGEQTIVTIPCDTANNVCSIPVPAPGFALVFLDDNSFHQASPEASVVQTFATTVTTAIVKNTATIDPSVLETSNGHGGKNRPIGSTSFTNVENGARRLYALSGIVGVVCVVVGAWVTSMGIGR